MRARYEVRLRRSRVTIEVDESETILEAAAAVGVTLPYSCAVGGCMACKARLVAGQVELNRPHGLPSSARDRGWILLCRACPRSDVEVDA